MNDFVTPADALQSWQWVSRDGTWATSLNVRGMSEQLISLSVRWRPHSVATDHYPSSIDSWHEQSRKIEVVKGASSVLLWNRRHGWNINFISERPGYSNQFKTSAKVSSGYHTVNKLQTNAATVNFMDKIWYISVNGSYRTAEKHKYSWRKLLNSQFNDTSWDWKEGWNMATSRNCLWATTTSRHWNVGIREATHSLQQRQQDIQPSKKSAECWIYFHRYFKLIKELRIKAYTKH